MAITNRNLAAGTKLVARYKGQTHTALVVGDEANGLSYELADKTTYKSLSAAGTAVMNGTACNGWRFWTVEGEQPAEVAKRAKSRDAKAKGKLFKQISRVPNQKGVEEGKTKWWCSSCMASFLADGTEAPVSCPQGHLREVADGFAMGD